VSAGDSAWAAYAAGMRSRARLVLLALGLAAVLTAGCTADAGVPRAPGDRVSSEEATALADLLHRNRQEGGADFVVTAPYSTGAVLTLTGEIDFRHSVGRAQAVTTFTDGRPDDTRTVFFSPKDLWIGDVRGLTAALTRVGLPKVAYLRRPLTAPDAAAGTPLMDVIVRILVNLSAPSGDDARDFLATGYTWQGQRSIDSRLASLFRLHDGRTVAVATTGNLLLQYVTPLVDGSFDVTVTLSDHGPRAIDLPSAGETAAVAGHQAIATALGI
jgi:hypothetical protein